MSAAVLLAIVCKTGLVAALALAGARLLRTRPARERVALLRLGLVLVAVLPLASQQIPALRLEAPSALPRALAVASPGPAEAGAAAAVDAALADVVRSPLVAADAPSTAAPAPQALPSISPWAPLAAVYALGVAVLLARLAAGVAGLARRTREAVPVEDPRWLAALARAAGDGPRPRLMVSPRPLAPLSWGLRPGVVLVGPDALAQAERADAVLAHELAHIRHGDWIFLMLSRLLVAVFWFNPLVWLLERELSRQSEHAADAWAVARVPRLDYAGALVALARGGRHTNPSAALGMADSELAQRVRTVLNGRAAGGRPWPTAAAAVACVGLAGPLAALELAPAAATPPLAAPAPLAAAAAAPAPLALAARPADASAPAATVPTPAASASTVAAAPGAPGAPEVRNLENAAGAMEASAAHLRALSTNPELRDFERARLQQEAAEVDARAAHMRRQAATIAARHAAQAQADAQAEADRIGVAVDVRMGRMPGAFIGAADMRNAANQMRADADGMKAHADNLGGGALPLPPGGAAELAALRRQADALHAQADDLDRQAEALSPP